MTKIEQALYLLWAYEDKMGYECPEVSKAINILQEVRNGTK